MATLWIRKTTWLVDQREYVMIPFSKDITVELIYLTFFITSHSTLLILTTTVGGDLCHANGVNSCCVVIQKR